MRSLIWDLGGTLVDTYPDVDRALAEAAHGGADAVDPNDLLEVARLTRISSGHAISTLAERHGRPEEELRAAYESTKALWARRPPPVMPGAVAVMRAVREQSGLNLVATHRERDSATQLLHDLRLEVDDLVCAPDGFERKPDPAMVLELLRRHRLDPEVALSVGDRPADVGAAQAAGVHGVLLETPGVVLEAPDAARITALDQLTEFLRPR